MSVDEVMNKLSWYSKTFTKIRDDVELTDGGRERQLENLRESFELYGGTAYREFEQAWSELRKEFTCLDVRRRAASQKAEDAWNYERLRYYSEQARADVARSGSMQELEKHIRRVVDSGSQEQARAYLESGSAVIAKYHGTPGLGSLTAWMDREAARLTRPPEFDAIDEREHDLILTAVSLRDRTQTAANMIPQSNISYLLGQVHIGAIVDSVTGNFSYTVNFREPVALAGSA